MGARRSPVSNTLKPHLGSLDWPLSPRVVALAMVDDDDDDAARDCRGGIRTRRLLPAPPPASSPLPPFPLVTKRPGSPRRYGSAGLDEAEGSCASSAAPRAPTEAITRLAAFPPKVERERARKRLAQWKFAGTRRRLRADAH